MSEQGWRGFLAADGVGDWVVVLHGGATAVFRVGSLREAARLAEAIAEVPGLEGSGALLTLADDGLTVRLNRDLWQLEPHHVDLARAVSAVAKAHGAVADRAAVQEVQLAIAAKPDAIDVDFWRAALGYSVRCSVRFTPIDARLIEGTPDAPTTFPLPVTDVTRRADPTRLLDWPVRGL